MYIYIYIIICIYTYIHFILFIKHNSKCTQPHTQHTHSLINFAFEA